MVRLCRREFFINRSKVLLLSPFSCPTLCTYRRVTRGEGSSAGLYCFSSTVQGSGGTNSTWDRSLDELDQLFLEIIRNYAVDVERIYLTGLSMGGFGTWHWAVHQPRAFAALVPICGGTWWLMGFPERIAVLKDVPIWAFHGGDDPVVPCKMTEDLVEVLLNLQAPIRFTKYAGVGHDSWTLAYNEPELIPWLLEQRNPSFSFREGGQVE